MKRGSYHAGHWIAARYASDCRSCRAEIMRGDTVLFLPAHGCTLCRSCGQRHRAPLGFIRAI
jgi:hypothetical protein